MKLINLQKSLILLFRLGGTLKALSKFLIILPLFTYLSFAKIIILDNLRFEENTTSKFVILNDSNKITTQVSKNDIWLKENDIGILNFDFQPPSNPIYNSSTILFLYDLSIGNINYQNKELSLQILDTLVKSLPKSNKALIGFDYDNYLFCNFTSETGKITSAFKYLNSPPSDGSNFDSAFYGFYLGALNFIQNSNNPKNIILITDKFRKFDFEKVQQIAKSSNIAIYVLLINYEPDEQVFNFTRQTNGFTFQFTSYEEFIPLISTLNFLLFEGKPAQISWQNLPLCSNRRLINLSYKSKDSVQFEITVENSNLPQIEAYPPFLRFSYVIPSKFKDLDLILVARNFDLRIDSLKLQNPHFKIVFGDIKSPMILPKDSAHRLTIRFTPTDSSIVFDSLVIYSDACKIRKVNITGGFPNKKPNEKTLTILSPKCGDYYFLGDTIFIQWEGVLPTDVVQLQYSTNGGESWDTLAVNVLGLGYKFFVNPKKFKESDFCSIRVIQIWPNNAGETIELRHKSAINSANFNRDASLIVTATNHPDEFATVWNPGTGKKLFELKGHTRQVNWATFDLLDRYIITASDDSTSILYDIKSGDSLHTFKAHNGRVTSANFSPDGNYLVTSGLDGKCFIWDLRNYNLVYTISTGINPIYFASFTPDTNFVAYASYDGNIYLFDIKQLKVVKTFSTKFGNNHIHHFSFYPEIKKLAAASHLGLIFIFNYDPSDTTTKVYPSFVLAHDTISYPAINTTYFNSNGSWLISAGSDARVLRWNPSTGELIDSIAIGEHSNSVTTAQFSFDDAMLLTSSWDTTAKIFNRTKLGLQIDTTDCLFSIISPQVIANDVDLGAAFIGFSKDTLVAPILINQSKAKVEIEDIRILDNVNQEFNIVKKPDKIILNPNDTLSLLLNFAPVDFGLRKAKFVFSFKWGQISTNLIGLGVPPPLTIIPNVIDLEEVVIGEFKDTLLQHNIHNRSDKSINILRTRNIGPDSLFFNIIDGYEANVVTPNNYHPLTIRFTPDSIGKRNTIIEIATNTKIPKYRFNILGEGVAPTYDSVTIQVGNFEARTGEIVKIPIILSNKHFINKNSNYLGFGFNLTFNKTILEPLDKTLQSFFDGNQRTLKIKAEKNNFDDSVLIELQFRVGLGNDSITPLAISNSYPLGKGKIVITEKSGSLKLVDLCEEGGVRLFEPDGRIQIGPIQPNPSNGITKVDFETIEYGKTKLELYDHTGNLCKVLLDQNLKPSKYSLTFDASSLESGTYLLILKTPNIVLTKILQIVK